MKNNGKYIVGLIILILVLVFGAGIIIVNRSSTARRIQVVYIPKARDDANDFWTSLLKGAQMAANEYDVDLTILAPDSEQDFEAQVRYIDEAIAMNPNSGKSGDRSGIPCEKFFYRAGALPGSL